MMGKFWFAQSRTAWAVVLLLGLSRQSFGGEYAVELSSPKVVDGSLVVVTVSTPEPLDETRITGMFEETQFPFFTLPEKNRFSGLLGIPHNHNTGVFPVKVKFALPGGEKSVEVNLVIEDGKYSSETLKVDSSKVTPSKKALVRIFKEIDEVRKLYSTITRTKFWTGPFVFPMQSQITSVYGTKRQFNGHFKSYHSGLDFKAPEGMKVFAPAPGIVVMTKDLFYTGNTVIIDHGYGLMTIYAHLSKIKVKKGRKVKTGDLLGLSGKTGRVSGPHLHWQVVVNKAKVNPMGLVQVLK